jgi:hypothetical protein
VIAGNHGGSSGRARTFTPMNVWDIRMEKGSHSFQLPAGWNTLLVVLEGTIHANGSAIAREAQVVALERAGETVQIEAAGAARVLLLAGEPIDEPVVGYGPFVMNSQQQIMQAIEDFNSGRFGQMAAQG